MRGMKQSKELGRKGSKFLPAGAADSIFIEDAKGSHIWDVDGNEYIDYKLGWGPVILGHSHTAIRKGYMNTTIEEYATPLGIRWKSQ